MVYVDTPIVAHPRQFAIIERYILIIPNIPNMPLQYLFPHTNFNGIVEVAAIPTGSVQPNTSPDNILPGPIGPEVFVLATITAIILTTWVYFDSRKRQHNTTVWTLIVGASFFALFIGGIISIGFYLVYTNKMERMK